MPNIISTTSPTPEGELLWCVHYMSSYYDNDPRMPGEVPISNRIYVLAKSPAEATAKAKPEIEKQRQWKDNHAREEIETTVVSLENLIPGRDTSLDMASWL